MSERRMKDLENARRRLEQIEYECDIMCADPAATKGEARAWRAIRDIARAGLAESRPPRPAD